MYEPMAFKNLDSTFGIKYPFSFLPTCFVNKRGVDEEGKYGMCIDNGEGGKIG